MNVTIKGRLVNIFPKETHGNFEKVVVWIEEQAGQYPNTYAVEFANTKIQEVDAFNVGNLVEITADVRGRHVEKGDKEWVFNSLSGWKINRAEAMTGKAAPPPKDNPPMGAPQTDDDDDLPF